MGIERVRWKSEDENVLLWVGGLVWGVGREKTGRGGLGGGQVRNATGAEPVGVDRRKKNYIWLRERGDQANSVKVLTRKELNSR